MSGRSNVNDLDSLVRAKSIIIESAARVNLLEQLALVDRELEPFVAQSRRELEI